jgi:hypothetical protein
MPCKQFVDPQATTTQTTFATSKPQYNLNFVNAYFLGKHSMNVHGEPRGQLSMCF